MERRIYEGQFRGLSIRQELHRYFRIQARYNRLPERNASLPNPLFKTPSHSNAVW